MRPGFDEPAPVLYAERGASWWPVLWGPAFCLVGYVVELVRPGGMGLGTWVIVALAFTVAAAVWVRARRAIGAVSLTPFVLRQGREDLPVERIAAVTDVGAQVGAKVLGGGWSVPKGTTALPIRLDDGAVVLAWARDAQALRDALIRLLERPS
ncbi:hypothetical protein [Allokutzneria albata]|uniref:DUF3093 domain-containing protein n=1 Tax=Allokutzneria albata TaxID=211114 RepID=A0A1G9Z6H6_ALLAB|nr:hypothetical protein [Allokutzneria albata]SDN16196.1 hypothetical protein SAMN04489726_5258 [Allokutzneria albata]